MIKQFIIFDFPEIFYMDFYNRVKQEAKKSTGYSLQEFIISIGLNHDSYYTLKRTGNLPRADEAVKIAKALGVTVEYLVNGTPPRAENSLLNAFNSLNDTGKQAAIAAVKGLYSAFPQ